MTANYVAAEKKMLINTGQDSGFTSKGGYMRGIKKVMLWACCTAPAVAGLVMSGAGVAGAATISSAAGHRHPRCDSRQLETWDLNGANVVDTAQAPTPLSYYVTFTQRGSCLTGTLTDSYDAPVFTGPVTGTVNGNKVTFSVTYPQNSAQGRRTFTGTITRAYNNRGAVSGTFHESGPEKLTGTWDLATDAVRACSESHGWWRWQQECPVR